MTAGEIVRARDSSAESGREGTVDVELLLEGQRVSSCRIVPLGLRIGAAVVTMHGIGLVNTIEQCRHRGFARRVMSHAIQLMEEGGAALTMLYGITSFYPKFGYITVGPESTISLPPLDGEGPLPEGYRVRRFMQTDLEELQRVYDRMTARSVGTAVRRHDGYPWTVLQESADGGMSADCRVVTDGGGRIAAYVWRGEGLQFVRAHSDLNPDDLIVAEVVAVESRAADAALMVCRRWAAEETDWRGGDVKQVTFFTAHGGPVTAAAMQMPSTFARGYGPDGGWMARVLSTRELFSALQPELSRRLGEAGSRFRGVVRVITDAGEAVLHIDGDGVRVSEAGRVASDGEVLACQLPQTTLARLAMGTYPSEDLLERIGDFPDGRVSELLQMMFPRREAQLFLADRF